MCGEEHITAGKYPRLCNNFFPEISREPTSATLPKYECYKRRQYSLEESYNLYMAIPWCTKSYVHNTADVLSATHLLQGQINPVHPKVDLSKHRRSVVESTKT